MKSFHTLCTGLACPSDDLAPSFLEQIVVGYAQNLLTTLLDSDGAHLSKQSRGLIGVLQAGSTTLDSFDATWDISFGELVAAMMHGCCSDVRQAAAGVALRMHQWGLQGEWELALDKPAYLQFDRWLLPLRECAAVRASENMVRVEQRGQQGAIFHFRREAGKWNADTEGALPLVMHDGGTWMICGAENISSPAVADQLLKEQAHSVRSAEFVYDVREFESVCTSAVQLIRDASPTYFSWVSGVLRKIVLIPLTSEITNSASAFLAPGTIAVSTRQPRVTLVEMLVHEASHQYLYIARRLGPIDDGTDAKLYYSPFKQTARPLLYIVFAFHAFANVLLFYKQLLRSGALSAEEQENITRRAGEIESNVARLHSYIASSSAVTRLGRCLWEPLARKLARGSFRPALQR